jgi:outer membrane usher protein
MLILFCTCVRGCLIAVGAFMAMYLSAPFAQTQLQVPAQAPTPTAKPAPSEAYPSFVKVRINGQVAAENTLILRSGKNGEQFSFSPSDIKSFRLALPPDAGTVDFDGQRFVTLNTIGGLSLTFDDVSQTLSVDAAAAFFESATIALTPGRKRPTPTASLGSFLTYDIYAQQSSTGSQSFASGGQFEWGIFTPAGVLTSTFFSNHTEVSNQFSRLDTVFAIDVPSAIATWRVGDTTSQSASWGNPYLFAGVQYTTNFGTQPGFISYPLNSLSGQTALPSIVDIYVNNVLTATQRVPQGPFTLNDLPNINGRGEIRLIVRDLLGREQAIVQSLYGSTQLLRPGLDNFSFQAGTLRKNYGLNSNDYGRGFASGVWHRGIDAQLTTEAGLELARGWQTAGLGATWLAGDFGEVSTSFAHSVQAAPTIEPPASPILTIGRVNATVARPTESRSGHTRAVRWDWRSSQLSVGAQARVTSPGFRTINNGGDFERPRRESSVFAGWGGDIGSFSLGYTEIQRAQDPQALTQTNTKLAQFSWSKSFSRWGQVSLNAFTSLTGETNHSITLGYFLPLDFSTASAGLSSSRTTSRSRSQYTSTASFQRNAPSGDGYGYHLQVTDRADAILRATAQDNLGGYALDVARQDQTTAVRIGTTGSVVYLGDEIVVGRRAEAAFALVTVPGFDNVRVLLNNQEVGRTNARGNLFVPRLNPYETNQIRIDQQDLPLSAEVMSLQMDATPFLRSGLVVRFAVRESLSGVANFVDEDGQPIPAGAMYTINGASGTVPIADRGEAFLTGLTENNRVRITLDSRSCTIQIPYKRSDDPQPFLGTFKCKLEN